MTEFGRFCKEVMIAFLNNPVISGLASCLSIPNDRIVDNDVSIKKSLVFWNGAFKLNNSGIRRSGVSG
jgi:hypothetical protein